MDIPRIWRGPHEHLQKVRECVNSRATANATGQFIRHQPISHGSEEKASGPRMFAPVRQSHNVLMLPSRSGIGTSTQAAIDVVVWVCCPLFGKFGRMALEQRMVRDPKGKQWCE